MNEQHLSERYILERINYLQNVQRNEPNTYTNKWESASKELNKLFEEMARRTA